MILLVVINNKGNSVEIGAGLLDEDIANIGKLMISCRSTMDPIKTYPQIEIVKK